MSAPMFGQPPMPTMERDGMGLPVAPVPPATPPAFAAPTPLQTPPAAASMPPMPQFLPQQPAPQQGGGMQQIAALLPALLMGIKDPQSMGAAMRGIQKARDRQLAQQETAEQNAQRKQRERVEFYSRMLENAAQFDDEIAFTDWKRAIAPVAEYYGIPTEAVVFNAGKGASRERKMVQDAVNKAIQRHGPEILNRDDVQIQLADGRTFSMPTARQMLDGGVTTKGGQAVPVTTPFKADNPNEMKVRAYAQSVGKTPEQLTPDEIQKAMDAGTTQRLGTLQEQANAANLRGDTKEYQRLLQVIKDTGLADNVPRVPNDGVNDGRRFSMEQRLVSQWDKANVPFREMRRQLGLMDSGLKRFRAGDTNGGSQAVLVTFQKILDPTSVVRESEYARTTEGQSLLNRIEGTVTRWAAGGTTLTESEMAALVDTARSFLDGMATFNAGLRGRIERTAAEYQLDPRLIFDDVGTAPQPATPPAPRQNRVNVLPPDRRPGATPAPAPSGKIRARDPQGNLHEAAAGTPLPAGWKIER